MKKRIAIAAAITASFALWAAVWPQTTVDKEKTTLTPSPAVIVPQAPLPEPTEPATPPSTETEEADGTIAEPVLEEADEQPSASDPEPTAENQAEPAPEPPAPLEPEPATGVGSSAEWSMYPASAG